jgi:hypothetical protein
MSAIGTKPTSSGVAYAVAIGEKQTPARPAEIDANDLTALNGHAGPPAGCLLSGA